MISSYQRLKIKMQKAKDKAEEIREDMEFVILYPYSSRAKNIRREVKDRHDG